MTVEEILKKENRSCDTSMKTHIDVWKQWYKGYSQSFHKYTVYNGREHTAKERASLKMAKRICEEWANLLLNEKVVINVGNEAVNKKLKTALTGNDFYVRANQLLEKTFALGTGAFVEYSDSDGEAVIDYITADMIYPISWNDTHISECAFASIKNIDGVPYYYINSHTLSQEGTYEISNRIFQKNDGKEVRLPKGIASSCKTNSSIPRFQIIRPNITNNIEENTPLGISVFANALNELMGTDLIYDSYLNEFRLGKKRIIVPTSMTQIAMQEDGVRTPIFDSNDVEFYSIPGMDDSKPEKLQEINMTLRSKEHKEALEYNLCLLSDKCGLGNERFSFSGDGVKTATEVISEKSDLFRNLKKHEIVIKSALIGMVKALLEIMKIRTDVEISVEFDDSIIEDHNAEFSRKLQMVSSGAMLPWELRAWELGETDEKAKSALAGAEDGIPEV